MVREHFARSRSPSADGLSPRGGVTIASLRPTLRGAVAGAIAIALLVAEIATGRSALFVFVLAVGLPFVIAPVLVLERGRRASVAQVQVMLTPPLVPTGDSCELSLHLTNTGEVTLPPLGLERPSDHWDEAASAAPRAITPPRPPALAVDIGRLIRWDPVGTRRHASSVVPIPTRRRGVFKIGPLRLWVHDPFGLFAMTVATAAPVTLVVHPSAAASTLPPPVRRGSRGSAPAGHHPAAAHADDPAGEWNGLRPYEQGDRLHLLSWQAEARYRLLLVHDFRPDTEDLVAVVLDDRAGVHLRRTFEQALSMLYGLVTDAARRGSDFEVATFSGRRVTGSATPEGMVELLTFLARTQPRRVSGGAMPPDPAPRGGSFVVTTQTALPTLPHVAGDPTVVVVE